jgi:two-component system, cell cycle sensor histidine kinase and response regulator CckA
MDPQHPTSNPTSFSWRWFNRLSLRDKTLFVGAARLIVLMLVLGTGIQFLIQRGFDKVETQYLQDHVERVRQSFRQSARTLERNVHDYAVWDDTYQFIEKPNQKYLEDNFSQDVLSNLRISHALIFDRELNLVAGRTLEPGAKEIGDTDPLFAKRVAPLAAELLRSGDLSSSGIRKIGDEIYLAAACRVLPTHPGRPDLGVFVHLRPVDKALVQEFSEILRIRLDISTNTSALAPGSPASGQNYWILGQTPDRLRVGIPIQDLANQTVSVVETVLPRDIQEQARRFIVLVWVALFLVLVATTLLWPLTMRWLVLGRLERIHRFVTLLGEKKTLTERLPAREGDELDALAIGINGTLDTLEKAQHQRDELESRSQRLQEQLTQVQKVEAIATMAGGVAHDFNNSLGSIMGSIELIREELPDDHPAHKHLTRMQKAGSGACALAKQMLNLSRSNPVQKTPIHLGDAVSDVLRLVRAGLPKTLEVHFQNTAFDDIVLADATQLQQVIMNLATNASHAMANQPAGCIEVSISETLLPDPANHPETLTLPPGQYLRLDCSDNGHGIPKEILTKVFDPFFTTKPVGSGTGLGLAVAQGFVARHKGSLGLQSEVGRGTTFTIHLPKFHAHAGSAPILDGQGLRILLVDDDTYGRETLATGLQRAGHTITEASNGAYALRLLEEHPEAYDAVVTDQIMPGMTGMDLCEQIQRCAPGVAAFLISGYTGPVDPSSLQEKGILRLFMKPVAMYELDQALRESMGPGREG